jgi:hypothetical protein
MLIIVDGDFTLSLTQVRPEHDEANGRRSRK